MENSSFDHIIKSKLEGLETSSAPQWDKLLAKKKAMDDISSDEGFDSVIKSKLGDLTVSSTPQWEKLLAKKTAYDNISSDEGFDTFVKSKLENLTTSTVPQWDLLLAKKDALDLETSNNFDALVKDKLDSLSTSSVPQWDMLLNKKNTLDNRRLDREFDERVRDEVGAHSVAYNSSHWLMLKERLQGIYTRRKQLYFTKSFEFLILMLLFTGISNNYINLIDVSPVNNIAPAISDTPIASNENVRSQNNTKSVNQIDNTSESTIDKIEDRLVNSVDVTNSNNVNNIGVISTVSSGSKEVASLISDAEQNLASVERTIKERTSKTFYNSENSTGGSNIEPTPKITSEDIRTSDIFASNQEDSKEQLAILDELANISNQKSLLIDDSKSGDLNEGLGVSIIDPLANLHQNSKWLHIAASYDNNIINSPYHEKYNPNGPTDIQMFGYSISGLFSVERKALEFETGLTYSVYNKQMRLRDKWETELDLFVYKLNNINYDIISVPLRAKYHFVKTPDWSLFLSGGLSPEVIVSAGYDEADEFLRPKSTDLLGTSGNVASDYKLNQDFNVGVLEGGSFSNNFLLRANVGFGMQRNITPTLTAYFSGDYYHSLLNKDYGPSDDKINKFAISFGLKERF